MMGHIWGGPVTVLVVKIQMTSVLPCWMAKEQIMTGTVGDTVNCVSAQAAGVYAIPYLFMYTFYMYNLSAAYSVHQPAWSIMHIKGLAQTIPEIGADRMASLAFRGVWINTTSHDYISKHMAVVSLNFKYCAIIPLLMS